MAIRNKPYLPLYVNDFMSDEKLLMCSAEATGVYIRLMCLMHKSSQYGKILLQQMHKKTPDAITNFASVLTKQLPFEFPCVKRSLEELISYNIISVENDELVQKRMVKDAEISEKRATSGQKGGFATANAKAKVLANSDIDIDNRDNRLGGMGEKEEGIITEPPKTEIIKMDNYANHPVDDLCKSYITGSDYQAVREAICFKNRVKMDQVIDRAKEFTMHLKSTGKLQTTMREFMTHFSNWMNTRPAEPVKSPKIVKI